MTSTINTSISPEVTPSRIHSIDFLRGVVMIIMALDHVRDYFHAGVFIYDPTDLSQTSTAVFLTRWITHFCAPVFVLLSGMSAYFMGLRKTKKELSVFLLKRGAWLIILDLVIMYIGWTFDFQFHSIIFNVIWMFGISMIALAAFIHFPVSVILVIGLLLVFAHNLLDPITVEGNNLTAFLWALVHEQSFFTLGSRNVLVVYPLIPWIGVIAIGYCLGTLYNKNHDAAKRKYMLLFLGGGMILLFLLLRIPNLYGDASHWSPQKTPWFSFLSILNTSKYPPSLLYLLMTLGPALIFLSMTEKANNRVVQFISVYGRVPLFYYVIHIYFIHLLAGFAAALSPGFTFSDMVFTQEILWFSDDLKGYGFSLGVVYLIWIGVVLLLYPLCKWYQDYKATNKEKVWLSYV